ncbi:hypothetical protein KAF26_15275 [Xanthomonas translucens pv. secalis]|uniref:hypothetical protein n=1 Tax=Xanthomonas campestris pv. translucens TaxID=343 RepID=UPI001F20E186|nr:hypothetical protein [Xanthomonas translucens]UKE42783.1 hypothetical protein KAF26_15275 [Xanthomonas translucens pv. secalis]
MDQSNKLSLQEREALLSDRDFRQYVIDLALELEKHNGLIVTVEIEAVLERFVEGKIDQDELSQELQSLSSGPILH